MTPSAGLKRAFGLLYNVDERQILRSQLKDFPSLIFAQNNEDAHRELLMPGRLDLLLIDERFEVFPQAAKRATSEPEALHLTEYIEALRQKGKIGAQTVLVVIMGEGRGPEDALVYSELGASLVLHRPMGIRDLRERIEVAARWVEAPSPELLLRRALRAMLEQSKFEEAAHGFEKLFERSPSDIGVGIELGRCWLQMGPERVARAKSLLETLDRDHPRSLQTKRLLAEAHDKLGDAEARSLAYVRLFESAPNSTHFRLALDEAQRLREERATMKGFRSLLAALSRLEAIRARAWRLATLENFAGREPNADELALFLEAVERSAEDRLALKASLAALYEAMESPAPLRSAATWTTDLRDRLVTQLLDAEPSHPTALRRYVRGCIQKEEFREAAKRVRSARDAKQSSSELFEAWAELSLAEGLMKEASDAIHLGRRHAPSDDRWDALADIWRARAAVERLEGDPTAAAPKKAA